MRRCGAENAPCIKAPCTTAIMLKASFLDVAFLCAIRADTRGFGRYELSNLVDCASHAPVCQRLRARILERIREAGEAAAEIMSLPSKHPGQRSIEYPNSKDRAFYR